MKPIDLLFQGHTELTEASRGPIVDFLLLRLGSRLYGVSISQIVEIIRYSTPTIVPRTPAQFLGIVSLRGQVLSIVDVRTRLDIAPNAPTSDARVVVVRDTHGDLVGVYVDEVLRVARVHEDQIEAPEQSLGSELKEHVQGLVRTPNDTFVAIVLQPLLD